jgi:predicted lipid-binding transport protein (Tim44 family)
MVDILFFAAIAFYIFIKLNKQLGNVDENEKKKLQDKILLKRKEISKVKKEITKKIQDTVAVVEDKAADEAKFIATLDSKIQTPLKKILVKNNISLEFFLDGAKSAFEMVLKAFSASDLKTLKFLLSDKLYKGFESSIKSRQGENQTLVTNVISIDLAEITSAKLTANNAVISIKFTSQQINYISDESGKVVDGKKEEISEVIDVWTFKKDVKSTNPNWTIISTNN